MVRRNRLNASYYCRHYYEVKSPGCCPHNVREEELIEIVKYAICRQAALAADLHKLIEFYMEKREIEQGRRRKEKMKFQDKVEKCKDESFYLYDRFKSGEIDKETFQELRQKNLQAQDLYQKQLDSYEDQADSEKQDKSGIFILLEGKEHIAELTKEIVERLVAEIYVYDRGRVEIVFKFGDELKKYRK